MRIPVSLAYTLKESTDANAIPIGTQIKTELIARRSISDNLQVTMIIQCILTIIYRTAFIEIGKFQITRFQNIRSGYF